MARKQRSSVNIPLPMPIIKLVGNWEKTVNDISILPKAIQKGYDNGTVKFGNKLLRVVKKAITSHQPPPGGGVTWKPLSRKSKGGGIYYNTGQYFRSIGIYSYRGRVLVGMPNNTKHKNGLTLNQLAIILEYGNGNIPARPLWRPSLKASGGTKELKRILLKEIRHSIISMTGISSNQIKGSW